MNKLPYSLNLYLPIMLIVDAVLVVFSGTDKTNLLVSGTMIVIGVIWLILYAVVINRHVKR